MGDKELLPYPQNVYKIINLDCKFVQFFILIIIFFFEWFFQPLILEFLNIKKLNQENTD